MQNLNKTTLPLLVALLVTGSLLVVGCARYASEEELKQLNDLKAEVSSLEKQVTEKEAAKASLEKRIASQNDKLKWCADEQEKVKQRLQDWK